MRVLYIIKIRSISQADAEPSKKLPFGALDADSYVPYMLEAETGGLKFDIVCSHQC